MISDNDNIDIPQGHSNSIGDGYCKIIAKLRTLYYKLQERRVKTLTLAEHQHMIQFYPAPNFDALEQSAKSLVKSESCTDDYNLPKTISIAIRQVKRLLVQLQSDGNDDSKPSGDLLKAEEILTSIEADLNSVTSSIDTAVKLDAKKTDKDTTLLGSITDASECIDISNGQEHEKEESTNEDLNGDLDKRIDTSLPAMTSTNGNDRKNYEKRIKVIFHSVENQPEDLSYQKKLSVFYSPIVIKKRRVKVGRSDWLNNRKGEWKKERQKRKSPLLLGEEDPIDETFILSLHTPEDKTEINPLHNAIRRDVWEVRRTMSGKIFFQCGCCKHLPRDRRQPLSIVTPRNVERIYRAFIRFMGKHIKKCKQLPKSVTQYQAKTDGSFWRGTKAYWVVNANRLGLVDSEDGKSIMFCPLAAARGDATKKNVYVGRGTDQEEDSEDKKDGQSKCISSLANKTTHVRRGLASRKGNTKHTKKVAKVVKKARGRPRKFINRSSSAICNYGGCMKVKQYQCNGYCWAAHFKSLSNEPSKVPSHGWGCHNCNTTNPSTGKRCTKCKCWKGGHWRPIHEQRAKVVQIRNRTAKKAACGQCDACSREDCGECIYCLDKPKFGGASRIRQRCIKRRCLNMRRSRMIKPLVKESARSLADTMKEWKPDTDTEDEDDEKSGTKSTSSSERQKFIRKWNRLSTQIDLMKACEEVNVACGRAPVVQLRKRLMIWLNETYPHVDNKTCSEGGNRW